MKSTLKLLSRKLLPAIMTLTLFVASAPMALADETLEEATLPKMEPVFATVSQINDREDYKSVLIKTDDGNEILLNVNDESIFLDSATGKTLSLSDLKENEKVLAYHSPFMTMSIPPQSYCFAIVKNVDEQLQAANLMQVSEISQHPDGSIQFQDADGNFIIIIIDLSDAGVFEQNGNKMIPLRTVAEKLGFEVKWISATKQVALDNGQISSTIRIGDDSYALSASSSDPVSYGAAPVIVNGSTYVPVQYIDLLLSKPGSAVLSDGILTVTAQ